MKKSYQIEAQRAVTQLEAMAIDGNPAMQRMLPMAGMIGWLKKGVGELMMQAGRTANRWGSEQGYCVVMGQKVPVRWPRVRMVEDKEVGLGSYEKFHRGESQLDTLGLCALLIDASRW